MEYVQSNLYKDHSMDIENVVFDHSMDIENMVFDHSMDIENMVFEDKWSLNSGILIINEQWRVIPRKLVHKYK